ncbi:MAG: ATP-dependent helicase HrpB [Pseudomonadota bacterium]
MSQLPIEGVMPALISGVRHCSQLILKAAPGAGKSTYFPLQLLQQKVVSGKIVMLEPRRLAAKNIARYLAKQLGEPVGARVGYRVRGEQRVSTNTQLEIVTEGILTRMLQSDPELNGVDMVIFDEFHERSIHADTALAFCLEVQESLRDDLKLVVMSATLDQAALAALMPEAEYVESEGRSYPVEFRYAPLGAHQRLEEQMAKQILTLIANESGSLLAFLPGVAAIKRVMERLRDLAEDIEVFPLYGQLDFSAQQAAILPAENGKRKIVLATNIAETSLTIEGIRLVVDSGYERVARFDLKNGVTRLEQVRIAQSSAEQRAGRAGRTEPGLCVRLYSQSQLAQQPVTAQPEILHSDLSHLCMELAQWGAQQVSELRWLDVPNATAVSQARGLLVTLGLLDEQGKLTSAGQRAAKLGVEPRISAMMVMAKDALPTAAAVAALLEEPEKGVVNFLDSVQRFAQGQHNQQQRVLARCKSLANRLGGDFALSALDTAMVAPLLAMAFPDRIAQARVNQLGRFVLANGHGAEMQDTERLAACDYLVVLDLMRTQSDSSVIFTAVELDMAAAEQQLPGLFADVECVDWDESKGRLVAEKQVKLGRLIIRRQALPEPPREKMTQALLNYIRRKGLSVLHWSDKSLELLQRLRCAADWIPEQDWPPLSDQALLDQLEQWLEPYLNGIHSVKGLAQVDLHAALLAYLGWPLNQQVDEWLPTRYQVPTGSTKKIRYQQGQDPVLSVRMQEMFGQQSSPCIALGRKALVLELLSPAQRPLQVTRDLASFWAGAYQQVQKEMKGRYPKHVWPDDPATHVATTKTKRQLNS